MSLILYKIKGKEIVRTAESTLEQDGIYIIIDKHTKKPKIWIWNGPNSNVKDRYFAGVFATTIKSQERLYGSPIEIIRGGSEPDQFPKLGEEDIIKPTAEEINVINPLEKEPEVASQPRSVEISSVPAKGASSESSETIIKEMPSAVSIDQAKIDVSADSPELNEEVKKIENEILAPIVRVEHEPHRASARPTTKKGGKLDNLFAQKLKGFLRDLSQELQSIENKINDFLNEL